MLGSNCRALFANTERSSAAARQNRHLAWCSVMLPPPTACDGAKFKASGGLSAVPTEVVRVAELSQRARKVTSQQDLGAYPWRLSGRRGQSIGEGERDGIPEGT